MITLEFATGTLGYMHVRIVRSATGAANMIELSQLEKIKHKIFNKIRCLLGKHKYHNVGRYTGDKIITDNYVFGLQDAPYLKIYTACKNCNKFLCDGVTDTHSIDKIFEKLAELSDKIGQLELKYIEQEKHTKIIYDLIKK